jgi:hypothetical protein
MDDVVADLNGACCCDGARLHLVARLGVVGLVIRWHRSPSADATQATGSPAA